MTVPNATAGMHQSPDRSGPTIGSFLSPPLGPPLRRRRAALALATVILVWLMLAAGLLTAPARAAGVPGSFTVSGVTSTRATLTWAASTGAIGYRVYRGPSTTADTALTLITTTDSGVLTYTSDNLRSRFGYKFLVAALDLTNAEARTASRTVTTSSSTDTTAPVAPASTSLGVSAFSANRVDVSWGASSSTDVAYYEVLRGSIVVGTVDRVAATKFSDNGLTPATTYSYSVRAVDSAGNRSLSVTKSLKTLATGTVKIVRGPYAVQVAATSAVVAWSTNIPSTGTVSLTAGTPGGDTGSGTMHKVKVTGLTAGTQYSYTVQSGGATATGRVRTAAPAGKPFTFAVVGDYGAGTTAESQNAAQIGTYDSDFVQTVGDNIYPSSGFPDPNPATTYSDIDGRVLKQMGPVFNTQAFFPANGNHEYYSNGQWWNAFPMPGTGNSYYSYTWGDAHIVVLDSMQDIASGGTQYNWASSDLGSAASTSKWQIVILPNPPYNATTSATGGSSQARAGLVGLFQTKGVDLVLSGDVHNYQRSKPLIDGAPVTTGGVTYIVSGGGGNGLNAFSLATMPNWEAFRAASYETLKVAVSSTALTVSAIAASGGAVLDTVTLGTPAPPGDTTLPSTPTGLSATATSSTAVSLTWKTSTDNVGVAHYNVYRGGTQLTGAPTGTTFTDSTATPSTPYSYTVQAVDAAGNRSGQSIPATVTTPAGGGGTTTVQVGAAADRTIDPANSSPNVNRLKVDATAPVNDLLMRFTVPAGCATVTAAHLELTVGSDSTDPSVRGGDFYATAQGDTFAGWSETTVGWNTAPVKTGTPPATLAGAVIAGTTYDVDVTSLLPAGTTAGTSFTIRGSNTTGDGAGYFSKEGAGVAGNPALGPQVVLTCSS